MLGREQDFSTTKIRRTLGWEPRIGYRDGLQATLAWLRDEHLPPAANARVQASG